MIRHTFRHALVLTLSAASLHAQAASRFVGTWEGALDVGAARLRLALVIERDSAALKGALISIDQGNARVPGTFTARGDTLDVILGGPGARYLGVINATGDSLKGTFTQGGSLPLVLRRTQRLATVVRPQDPKPPFPYASHDVTFESVPGVRLAGTVTTPQGPGPFPAVVFISGSGPQNRDEELMGHKPFLVIADYLARHGIASLRYDDRGIANSTGSFGTSTSQDFARDAEAAFKTLRQQAGVDAKKVGFVGHSEGGLIAPLVASQNRDVAFLVLLAGPGLPGDSILMLQTHLLAAASGATVAQLERAARINRSTYDAIRNSPDSVTMMSRLNDVASAMALELHPGATADTNLVRSIMQQIGTATTPWYRWFIKYDPRPALRLVKVPVLAMNGTLDLQVPHRENLDAIKAALNEAGNRNVEIVELPNLNHLFQTAKTGLVTEYAAIDETFSTAALERIVAFINKRFASGR